ncbi:MAG: hypothetical protein HY077_12740 [Elusimicrobia bacterium]|nr:hypothetical protein [Elusimicrobiota bacterium]
MATNLDEKKKGKRRGPPAAEERAAERVMIRKSMRRWESMDGAAKELGRGLGKKELIDRVAKEVGTSLRQVHCALRGGAR